MGQITTLLNFHSTLPFKGTFSLAELDPGAQHHLKVLRIRSGEEFRFIDGQGSILHTRCTQIRPPVFEVLNVAKNKALTPKIELCLAAPKGDLLWEAVTQATEVGVSSIRLIRSQHVQYTKQQDAPTARVQKISDSACEQCSRAWRVEVHPNWHKLEDCLKLPGTAVVADENLSTKGIYGFAASEIPTATTAGLRIFIGPEGGWSEEERQILGASARAFGLGPLILRVPTAAATAIHLLRGLYSSGLSR